MRSGNIKSRRLVVCLDGTWNVQEDTTNVWRISALVSDEALDGGQQLVFYEPGVGTRWYDRITGGAFGAGVLQNVKEAYCWLADKYREGDQVFLFGFSRGAVTALSLANLIDRCGIVSPEAGNTFAEAYRLYRLPGFTRRSPAARRFRMRATTYPDASPLVFMGLWDTVASLFARKFFDEAMHVLALPESVRCVMHALALDENRRFFQPVVFDKLPQGGVFHQRWFSGAHANVGGGYVFDPLAFVPLRWIARGAAQLGLHFKRDIEFNPREAFYARERDSHWEFAFGVPALLAPVIFRRRRTIRCGDWIDSSAIARFNRFPSYRASCKALATVLRSRNVIDGVDLYVE